MSKKYYIDQSKVPCDIEDAPERTLYNDINFEVFNQIHQINEAVVINAEDEKEVEEVLEEYLDVIQRRAG
jgi:hypothetical protein